MNDNNENVSTSSQILNSLEKRGVLDNLRAYMRSDIFTKLKEDKISILSKTSKSNTEIYSNEKIKLLKLSTSLIVDFMKKHNINYALSVFIPECKNLLNGDELYTESEISKLSKITYRQLEECNNEGTIETCFLNYILKNLSIERGNMKSTESQTDIEFNLNLRPGTFSNTIPHNSFNSVKFSPLEDKLRALDIKYAESDIIPPRSIEEKVIKIKRELEVQYKLDLEMEVERIRSVEMSQMRIDENRKYMRKIDEIREEYEKEYSDKHESLRKKELDINLRNVNKEKEIELQIYENRQKYLLELNSLKNKQNELRIKSENDANQLKIEEEKLYLKQKELDYAKEITMKKNKEELEQFKLNYDRLFENEKNDLHKKKLEIQEKEIKFGYSEKIINNLENEKKVSVTEKENLKEDYKNLEKLFSTIKQDNEILRDELKIISNNEKRNADTIYRYEIETQNLRQEIKFLKDSLENQKKFLDEKKLDQNILLENLNNQLNENFQRNEKLKNNLELENERLKKYYENLIEKEIENTDKKIKNYEKKVHFLEDQCKKHKNVHNVTEITNLNLNKTGIHPKNYFNTSMKMNNYFNDIKTSDRLTKWSKLEKEADEIKNELKTYFKTKSNRDERFFTTNNLQLDNINSDIYNKMNSSKINEKKDFNIKKDNQIENIKHSNKIMKQDDINIIKSGITDINKNIKLETESVNKIINDKENEVKKITIDKVSNNNELENKHDMPNIDNVNNNNNHKILENKIIPISSTENIINLIPNIDSLINIKNAIDPQPKESQINTLLNNESRTLLENELTIIKQDYNNKIYENEKQTPIIIGTSAITTHNNINHFERQDSNADFSIANLTSSNEWDLDSNRKDIKASHNNIGQNINKQTINAQTISQPIVIEPSVIEVKKDMIINTKPVNMSIKEESEEKNSFNESANDFKNSFNKFSNLNINIDKNEIEEDLKHESEIYEYDFVAVEEADGVDAAEKKVSLDLDAFKYGSINFNNSYNGNKTQNNNNTSSKYKSQSSNMEKLLQSKSLSSNIEETIMEDISVDNNSNSKKELPNSANTNTIDEDSACKYNEYYNSGPVNNQSSSYNNMIKNIMKDSNKDSNKDSQKLLESKSKSSDIKEDILQDDDDGYEPVDHNFSN